MRFPLGLTIALLLPALGCGDLNAFYPPPDPPREEANAHGYVHGQVTDPDGSPLAGASIQFGYSRKEGDFPHCILEGWVGIVSCRCHTDSTGQYSVHYNGYLEPCFNTCYEVSLGCHYSFGDSLIFQQVILPLPGPLSQKPDTLVVDFVISSADISTKGRLVQYR